MSDLRKISRIAVSMAIVFVLITASATAVKPTNPLDAVWDAIYNLQQEVDVLRIDLQNQIDNIELIPGPKGDTGAQGLAGQNGISCWDLNGNGIGDPAEDVNSDNNYDALDCKGQKGDTGNQGIQGLKGDTGEQGPSGISSWERVSATSPSTTGEYQTIMVSCTGDKKVLGGGAVTSYGGQGISAIKESYPSADNKWTATATMKVDGTNWDSWSVTAWAICATVS